MKVTEQIDALRTLGVNYIKRLIVPRMLAALFVFPLLTILADVLGILGGMVVMFLERGADMYAYWNVMTYWVVPKDFLMGVAKSVVFGAIVTLIGCYNGLTTEGGTEGLGRATTATVVHVTMGVIISDFFLTKLLLILFLVGQPWPIHLIEARTCGRASTAHRVLRGRRARRWTRARRWWSWEAAAPARPCCCGSPPA